MIRLRHKMLIRAMRVLDQLVLAGTAFLIIWYFPEARESPFPTPVAAFDRYVDVAGLLLLVLGWIGIFDYYVRYRADRFVGIQAQFRGLLKATTAATFWLLVISAVFQLRNMNAVGVLAFWLTTTGVGLLTRVWSRWALMSARKSGYNYRYLLIVGANERAAELAQRIESSPELGYKLVGFVAGDEEAGKASERGEHPGRVLGVVGDLRRILEKERVDELLVCLSVESNFGAVASMARAARDLGIVFRIVPDQEEGAVFRNFHIEEFDEEYVVTFFRERLLFQLLAKRVVDMAVSGAALLALSPLMLATALLIKLTSPGGPVLFAQDRVGMNQRRFKLYKFRSMVPNAEQLKAQLAHLNEVADGPAFKMENDPRITPLGRFIRKTSIDELPQLFNVLKGEMSLVGPRPPLPDEVKQYRWLFRRRLSVKPGITCVWQVSGRSGVTFSEWMKMDKEYVENWSLWLDIKILFKTIPAVLFGKGAH